MRYLSALLVSATLFAADMTLCICDVTKPETLEARQCSLCKLAEQQAAEPPVFAMKDSEPTKPNRWLILPRFHGKAGDPLADMTADQRLQLWAAAIEKGKSLWGEDWGLAVNGLQNRTQCHFHIHVGKLLPGLAEERFIVVDRAAEIPVPDGVSGLLVHPVDGKLHVHSGTPSPEPALLR